MAGDKGNKKKFVVLLVLLDVLRANSQSGKDEPSDRLCSRPTEWITQEKNVCYGKGKQQLGQLPIGNFKIKGNHKLVALRLVHVSGSLTCVFPPEARWGCRSNVSPACNSDCFTTLVKTPDSKTINSENRNIKGLFTYPGFTIDDDVLVIKSPDWPLTVKDGDQFSIVVNGGTGPSGIHCVDVDASFLE